MKPLSIIVPAWKCQQWLEPCLASLAGQTYFQAGGRYEILLGIDACQRTRAAAWQLRSALPALKIYWFKHHSGPYLIRNTLAAQAMYHRRLFFDADDVARPELVQVALGYDRELMYFHQKYMGKRHEWRTWGQFFIQRHVWEALGGFYPGAAMRITNSGSGPGGPATRILLSHRRP
jgi:glycosyltransferase involved in cell wall biosynthesis